jgi:hypothetical protein
MNDNFTDLSYVFLTGMNALQSQPFVPACLKTCGSCPGLFLPSMPWARPAPWEPTDMNPSSNKRSIAQIWSHVFGSCYMCSFARRQELVFASVEYRITQICIGWLRDGTGLTHQPNVASEGISIITQECFFN